MDPTENFHTLHEHEEEVRAKSLAAIEQDPALRDHWANVAEAMSVVHAFAKEHEHQSDDDLTLQLLGIRLFNAAGLRVVELAAKHHLPAIFATREFVDAGGLLSYAANYPDLYRRAAGYVNKIFRGAKAGDLPVEQPTKLELIINIKTAKALGLDVPFHIQQRVDEMIE